MNPVQERGLTRRDLIIKGLTRGGLFLAAPLFAAACTTEEVVPARSAPVLSAAPTLAADASAKINQSPIPNSPERELGAWGLSIWKDLLIKTQKVDYRTLSISVTNPDVLDKVYARLLRSIPVGSAAPAAATAQEMEDTLKITWVYRGSGKKLLGEAEIKRIQMSVTNVPIAPGTIDEQRGLKLQGRVDISFWQRTHSFEEMGPWPYDITNPKYKEWKDKETPTKPYPLFVPADWASSEGFEVMLFRDSQKSQKIYPTRPVWGEVEGFEFPAPFIRNPVNSEKVYVK